MAMPDHRVPQGPLLPADQNEGHLAVGSSRAPLMQNSATAEKKTKAKKIKNMCLASSKTTSRTLALTEQKHSCLRNNSPTYCRYPCLSDRKDGPPHSIFGSLSLSPFLPEIYSMYSREGCPWFSGEGGAALCISDFWSLLFSTYRLRNYYALDPAFPQTFEVLFYLALSVLTSCSGQSPVLTSVQHQLVSTLALPKKAIEHVPLS
ncbi:uncharacterized protein CLUP02_03627 [Colletotrichum lupini]|uniref:Uncharacterized protein n=1 Tax=Colletotrichum lupini TaxID=145971 RepID=A0A9Q8SJ93_9PEZI|nr:uncharacterized protein CLUP02_03627 [Colletotrichum lupini]UQC78153.1 hypothetical protein CLUP02_03627 [Colletotrichum lupini]